MSRLLLLAPLAALPAVGAAILAGAAAVAQPAPPGPPPGPPTYQVRDKMPEGSRTAARSDGAQQFSYHCGSCHLPFGMGTNILTKQRMQLGETPDRGLLANRDDLTAEYVTAVARQGKGAMPPLSRVEVTDAELKAIAGFLGRDK